MTGRIFVESVSQFVEEGVSVVTFCVSDNDNNVAKATCNLRYTDYERPELVLSDDLVFERGQLVGVEGSAKVTDKFEGDITDRLSAAVNDVDKESTVIPVTFKLTTEKGYTYKWELNIRRVDPFSIDSNYSVKLKNNLLIVPAGSKKPDFMSLVTEVTHQGAKMKSADVSVVVDSSRLNLKKPGTYDVWFELRQGTKRLTRERLIVICEEKANERIKAYADKRIYGCG